MEQAQLLITYLVAALLCVGGKKMGYHLSFSDFAKLQGLKETDKESLWDLPLSFLPTLLCSCLIN